MKLVLQNSIFHKYITKANNIVCYTLSYKIYSKIYKNGTKTETIKSCSENFCVLFLLT